MQNSEAPFTVETPAGTPDKLEVSVAGPDGAALPASNVKITGPDSAGKFGVVYTPPSPGMLLVGAVENGCADAYNQPQASTRSA